MQMTMDMAVRPGLLQAFALRRRSGYVMRSEKRPGYGKSGEGGPRGRKPKKRRPSFLYMLLTILVSIILWPVGMVLLWRRKVRLQAGTKLLISLLTFCVSIFLIVFALTVSVPNPQITAFQDKANDWLNQTASGMAVVGDAAYHKGVDAWNTMTDFAEKAYTPAMNTLADGIDKGVALAGTVRGGIFDLIGQKDPIAARPVRVDLDGDGRFDANALTVLIPEGTPDPESAVPLESGTLKADGSLKADGTPAPTASPAPTEVNGVEVALPTFTPTPSPSPTPTPSPTPVPEMSVEVKPAGEATVYYNERGKLYHMRSSCNKMSGAKQHTLAEALAAGKQKCGTCGTPDGSILDVARIAWADGSGTFHTTDACARFEGDWQLISLNEAIAGGLTACPDCEADLYALHFGDAAAAQAAEPADTSEVTDADASETADAPTPEPTDTPEPAPVSIRPLATLKSAAEATVYRSSNGKFYHKVELCKGMTGSSPYKLSDIQGKYKRCGTCDAPAESLIGQTCLWADENGLCHTTDECALFQGTYTLILRDEALAAGMKGCADCGCNEYLIAGTVLAE